MLCNFHREKCSQSPGVGLSAKICAPGPHVADPLVYLRTSPLREDGVPTLGVLTSTRMSHFEERIPDALMSSPAHQLLLACGHPTDLFTVLQRNAGPSTGSLSSSSYNAVLHLHTKSNCVHVFSTHYASASPCLGSCLATCLCQCMQRPSLSDSHNVRPVHFEVAHSPQCHALWPCKDGLGL